MSKKDDLIKWINAANAFAPKLTEDTAVQLPLVTEVSKGLFKVNAPTVTVTPTGNIYSRGNLFKHRDLEVSASVTGEAWDELTREELIHVLGMLKTNAWMSAVAPAAEAEAEAEVEVEVEAEAEVEVEAEAEAEAEAEPDFDAMTKRQIDEWAAERGIELDGRASKTDMLATLKAKLAE